MAKLAAVLLAAGASSRFGAENKLLMHLNGRPLVRGVAEEVLRSGIAELVVVTGCDAPLIEEALSGLPVRFARNEMWQTGMGSSIAAGVRALDTTIDGAFIVPADMPFLSADLLGGLMSAFERHDGARTIYPATPEGAQRNPVLWPRRTFPSLASLSGPQGAKPLLQSRDVSSVAVSVNDSTLLEDIDTPAALAAAQSAAR
jgi:molybdenum cofactor cytidylyltransferase